MLDKGRIFFLVLLFLFPSHNLNDFFISFFDGGQVYWGAPAPPYKDAAKQYAAIRKLPEAMKEMAALKKQAAEIKELIDQALAEQAGN